MTCLPLPGLPAPHPIEAQVEGDDGDNDVGDGDEEEEVVDRMDHFVGKEVLVSIRAGVPVLVVREARARDADGLELGLGDGQDEGDDAEGQDLVLQPRDPNGLAAGLAHGDEGEEGGEELPADCDEDKAAKEDCRFPFVRESGTTPSTTWALPLGSDAPDVSHEAIEDSESGCESPLVEDDPIIELGG